MINHKNGVHPRTPQQHLKNPEGMEGTRKTRNKPTFYRENQF